MSVNKTHYVIIGIKVNDGIYNEESLDMRYEMDDSFLISNGKIKVGWVLIDPMSNSDIIIGVMLSKTDDECECCECEIEFDKWDLKARKKLLKEINSKFNNLFYDKKMDFFEIKDIKIYSIDVYN